MRKEGGKEREGGEGRRRKRTAMNDSNSIADDASKTQGRLVSASCCLQSRYSGETLVTATPTGTNLRPVRFELIDRQTNRQPLVLFPHYLLYTTFTTPFPPPSPSPDASPPHLRHFPSPSLPRSPNPPAADPPHTPYATASDSCPERFDRCPPG